MELGQGATLELMTMHDLEQVFLHMREQDRADLAEFGITTMDQARMFAESQYSFVGKYLGKPVCCFGALRNGDPGYPMYFWFISTDEISRHWLKVHRVIQAFLPWIAAREWESRLLVMKIGDGSIPERWLRRIGFRPVDHVYRIGPKPLRFFEYEGNLV